MVSGQILIGLVVTRKTKKKDHQNRTIINEMATVSVPSKVLFLWTVVQVELPKSLKTHLNPYSGPPKLINIIQKHKFYLSSIYYFASYEK